MKLNIKKFMMTEMGGELEETIKERRNDSDKEKID